jgi:hypothetical protein
LIVVAGMMSDAPGRFSVKSAHNRCGQGMAGCGVSIQPGIAEIAAARVGRGHHRSTSCIE